jgi:hypothetical protein
MNKNKLILPLLLLFLFAAYFALLKVIPADYNDIHDHAAFARQMCTGEIPYTGNFLVYLLVNVFSFFTAKVTFTEISLCLLLAFAGTYRYYLSNKKISQVLNSDLQINQPINQSTSQLYSHLLALSMLFVFVIPIPSYFLGDNYMYIGNYSPNVWHNSTILFLFPFALILFELSYKQLQAFESKRNWLILLLIVLNLVVKPSYFLVFICAYPLMLLIQYGLRKQFWLSILPIVAGMIVLIIQYIVIYKISGPAANDSSSVVFMPFYKNPELNQDMINIPFALIFSLLFPILYSTLNIKRIYRNRLFIYTLITFVFSVIIFFSISETGRRASHGNYYWQIVITTWLCFFVALLSLLKDFKTEGKTIKNNALFSIFGIHVLVGIIYFIRILITGNYY